MDFLTHGLISFLFGYGLGPNYAMFAVLMGVFPDFDVVLVPLAIKYDNPTLHHRGGVHSLLVLGIANLIGAFIMNSIIPGSLLLYFGIGFFCSSMHLFCDILTTFHIRPFWPFNKKEFKLDITEAVNVLGICFSAILGFLLYRSYHISPSPNFTLYLIISASSIIGFISLQVIAKYYLARKLTSLGSFQSLPSIIPLFWKVLQKQTNDQEINIKLANYNIMSRQDPKFQEFNIKTTPTTPPISTESQAVQFTYSFPEVKKHQRRIQNPLYCVRKVNNHWKVYWYSAEMIFFNRTFAMVITLDPSGNYSAESISFHVKDCENFS